MLIFLEEFQPNDVAEYGELHRLEFGETNLK